MSTQGGSHFDVVRAVVAADLPPSTKLVLLALYDRQGQNGQAWPSLSRLSRDTHLGRKAVVRAIATLEVAGLLAVKRPRRPSVKCCNRYLVHTGVLKKLVSEGNWFPFGQELVSKGNLNDKGTAKVKDPPTPQGGKRAPKASVSTRRGRPKANEPPEGFDDFWRAYPRKVAKAAAVKAWRKLNPDTDLVQTIMQAVERQKETPDWQKDGGKYIPHPATWLNGHRWEDEVIDEFEAAGLSAPISEERARKLLGLDG